MPEDKKWVVSIEDKNGNIRDISLSHTFATEDEATSEAENIADQEYTEKDIAWSLDEIKNTDYNSNNNF